MQDSTTGWVTFQKIPLHDGRVIVVQKKDGESRSRIVPRPLSRAVVDRLSRSRRVVGC